MEQAEITLLRFPENVRMRKEMYLIDPNHCIYEIVDNSVDEFDAGRAKLISVKVLDNEDGFRTIVVKDDGGGIPTSMSKELGHLHETQAEVALANLTAGGKFGKRNGYKTTTAGLHGVGASCVNATSEVFLAKIVHNGTETNLRYEKGILQAKDIERKISDKESHFTEVTFTLDRELWKGEDFDLVKVRKRLHQLAYLNSGLRIVYEYNDTVEEYYQENGLTDYFNEIISGKEMLDKPVRITKVVPDEEVGDIAVDVVFGYNRTYSSEIYSFVNNVATVNGGDHQVGFTTGVAKTISSYYGRNDKYKTLAKNLANEDTREGLCAIVTVKVMYPKFEGQSKASIKMPQVRSAVYNAVTETFAFHMEDNPGFVKQLGEKLEKAYKGRLAAKRAREAERGQRSALDSSIPEKLAGCSSKKPEECSLYIVEGDSAAGSAIQGRDSKTQAILPVFGKILNTEKSRPGEAVANPKLLDVVKAMKCGIGKDFNIDKLRYHKIIIMADADVDGFHISALWITFFYRFMPEIVDKGHLYIALSPIYRLTEYSGKKEKDYYFFSDAELDEFTKKHKTKNKTHVAYIKGLGELQPKQLWESTMDPDNRRLIRVTARDAEAASRAISECMGGDTTARKKIILENADFDKAIE